MHKFQDCTQKGNEELQRVSLFVLFYHSRDIHRGLKSYSVISPMFSFFVKLQLSRFGGIHCIIHYL